MTAAGALLGSVQYPVLTQDPSPPVIAGGATLTAVKALAPGAGTIIATYSADVSLSATLTSGSNTVTVSGTALVLQVECAAGDTVTFQLQANSGPSYKLAAAVSYTSALVIPGDLHVLGNLTVDGNSTQSPGELVIPFVPAGTYPALRIGPGPGWTSSENSSTAPITKGTWNLAVPDNPSTTVAGLLIHDTDTPAATVRQIFECDDHLGAPIFWVNNSGGANITDNFAVKNGSLTTIAQILGPNGTTPGQVQAAVGSNAHPGLSFFGHTDAGVFFTSPLAVDTVNFATAGTTRVSVNSVGMSPALDNTLQSGGASFRWVQVNAGPGSAATPALALNDATSGLYYLTAPAHSLAFSLDGTGLLRFATGGVFPLGTSGAMDLGGSAQHFGTVWGTQLQAANGAAATPSITFNNATDTGLYLSATAPNTLGIAAGGSTVATATSTGLVLSNGATATTQASTDSSTKVATTAFVYGALATTQGNNLIGQQAAYNAQTANWVSAALTANTWTASAGGSGTAPSIVLPNDGKTYRIVLHVSGVSASVTGTLAIGIGTATNNIYATSQVQGTSGGPVYTVAVMAESVTGSGQTVTVFVRSAGTNPVITFNAAAAGSLSGESAPAELAAYRVA